MRGRAGRLTAAFQMHQQQANRGRADAADATGGVHGDKASH
jgi:hypothetical protein